MKTIERSTPPLRPCRPAWLSGIFFPLALWACAANLTADDAGAPEVAVFAVTPAAGSEDSLVPDWEEPVRPAPLGGKERQAVLAQVGGGAGGVPLINDIQTSGRTPQVRHLILSVKRPWYQHRGFLSAEGAQRVDARSVMHFDESFPGRAIVGLKLVKGRSYLLDFLVSGEGEGSYLMESESGTKEFPDPKAKMTHVLVGLDAAATGWTEVSLRRNGGAFSLHNVEVTLARGPNEEQ